MNNEQLLDNSTTEDLVKLSFFNDVAKSIVSCKSLKETLDEIMKQIGRRT